MQTGNNFKMSQENGFFATQIAQQGVDQPS
jgi:hypothetical protein